MIVAALIMGVSNGKNKLSDAQIIKRAEELGYTQSSVLLNSSKEDIKETVSSVSDELKTSVTETGASVKSEEKSSVSATPTEKEKTSVKDSKQPATSVSISGKTSVKEEKKEAASVSEKEVVTPSVIDPMPEDEPGYEDKEDYILIKVIRGDSSVSVSRRLFEAGLIESAVEFDHFLCTNGYDKSISVGEYEIKPGMDFETIAKIITRKQ